jgi:dolichol-phosphate mannosyltransferase
MRNATVIIPTYNEAMNIVRICAAVLKAAPEAHILIVDDNSPDGTGTLANELAKASAHISVLERKGKEGLGKAYLHAFAAVLAESDVKVICTMDADFSHDPADVPKLIKACDDYDVAIGSRYVCGGRTVGWSLWRRVLSWGGNLYAGFVTRIPVRDLTAGFIAVRTDTLRTVGLENINSSGYAYQIELKCALWKSGARITEVPITFRERIGGESKISGHIVSEGIIAPWKIVWKK